MCLETTHRTSKIAKEDIYTLKLASNVTKKSCTSFYREAIQKYGELQSTKFSSAVGMFGDKEIEKGLHSLISNTISCHTMYITSRIGIILCKIPKGSRYYLGRRGDIASNQLILIEPIIVSDDCKGFSKFKTNDVIFSTTLFDQAVDICASHGIKIGL